MSPEAASTKERIVEAALAAIKQDGFAGVSARTIARRGGFNQALIFYHFGTLDDLLLAALDATSARRMARYREALRQGEGFEDRVRLATELYREDLESGHITVLTELIGGSLSRPGLGPEIARRVEPWIELAEEVIRDLVEGSVLAGVIRPRAAALAVVAVYLGVDVLSHLDPEVAGAEALFEMAADLSRLATPLLGGAIQHETKEDR